MSRDARFESDRDESVRWVDGVDGEGCMRLLIGIDDTDYGDSIGTGALARELCAHLARDTSASPQGITRHQFLVHPDIPYTSHNSSACIALAWPDSIEALIGRCRAFLQFLFHPGADPGLCVAPPEVLAVPDLVAFGRRAQREVLRSEEATELARRHGVFLEALGGTGQGVIGALAGGALRASGEDGRFLALPGARQIDGEVLVGDLLARVAIDAVIDADGLVLASDARVDTRGWVRPELRGGRVVLPVERRDGFWTVMRRKGGDNDF